MIYGPETCCRQRGRFLFHLSLRLRYICMGGGGIRLCHNTGHISVLNHEGEPMVITQATLHNSSVNVLTSVMQKVNMC